MTCKDCICYEACKYTPRFEQLDQSVDAREWCPIFEHKEEYKKVIHAKYRFQYYDEFNRMDILKCTNCDDEFGVDENKQGDFYCPYCGAKMDKE